MSDAMTPEQRISAIAVELCCSERPVKPTRGLVRSLATELRSTRASLAECEAKLTAAESRVAELQDRGIDMAYDQHSLSVRMVTILDAADEYFARLEGSPAPLGNDGAALAEAIEDARALVEEFRIEQRAFDAALSPSQDAKTGGDV